MRKQHKQKPREPLVCSRCGSKQECPHELAKSTFAQQPFVCDNCRCEDCSIVFNIDCECGHRHGDPSAENPRVCEECILIRKRVAELDPDLLRLRNAEMDKEDPVYEIALTGKIIPSIVTTCDRIEFHDEADVILQNKIGENTNKDE